MALLYNISGEVIRGNRIGRQLGFPTANLCLEAGDPVPDGVYAARARVCGGWYNGMANVGMRPTVTDDPQRLLEVSLFDFDGDIYGETIRVELVAFLRPGRKFDTVEALRRQIARDRVDAERFFNGLK
jgi:riboflavin kinase/FMN adenylyltransferase